MTNSGLTFLSIGEQVGGESLWDSQLAWMWECALLEWVQGN